MKYFFVLFLSLSLVGCDRANDSGVVEAETGSENSPSADFEGQRNILLISIDTLRADHLSAYGYPRQTSPTLDRLASEGTRFASANVQWPKTGPSFASMLTSTYPSDNGIVRHVGIEMPCTFRMLAEELKAEGYSTHAVVSNGALASELRFDQGFDSYIETWKIPVAEGVDPSSAETVNSQAALLLDKIEAQPKDKPWFLWVHYLDPHFPYEPPEPFRDRFQNDEHFDDTFQIPISEKSPNQQMVQLGYQRVLDDRTDLAFYVARYDAEIAYSDSMVERLLSDIEGRQLLDNTMTVVTSDHGDSLGEHYYYFDHGRFAFDTCAEVPLIIHQPGVVPERVVETPVALIDLAPTLLEAAGVELPEGRWMQGQSLAPFLFTGERTDDDGVVFIEAGFAANGAWQRVARDDNFKLVYSRAKSEQQFIGGANVPFTLYHNAEDPGETENAAEAHPEELDRLRRLLWNHTRDEPFAVNADTEHVCEGFEGMDSETESQLRALGYLQ